MEDKTKINQLMRELGQPRIKDLEFISVNYSINRSLDENNKIDESKLIENLETYFWEYNGETNKISNKKVTDKEESNLLKKILFQKKYKGDLKKDFSKIIYNTDLRAKILHKKSFYYAKIFSQELQKAGWKCNNPYEI